MRAQPAAPINTHSPSHPLADDSTRHRRHRRSAFGRLITRSPVRSQVTQGADYFLSFFCRLTASVLSTFRLPYPNSLLSLPLVSISSSLSHSYSISIIKVTVSPKGLRIVIARPRSVLYFDYRSSLLRQQTCRCTVLLAFYAEFSFLKCTGFL
jgi:hypothetical protein